MYLLCHSTSLVPRLPDLVEKDRGAWGRGYHSTVSGMRKGKREREE
jgi:hypothetical protein